MIKISWSILLVLLQGELDELIDAPDEVLAGSRVYVYGDYDGDLA
jgi:hypothetical protein